MKWMWAALGLAIVVEIVVPLVIHLDDHGHHDLPWWHTTPAVMAVYGLVGCWLIVVVSKAMGKIYLQRPEAPDA